MGKTIKKNKTDDDYFENVLLILTCFCFYSLLFIYHGE